MEQAMLPKRREKALLTEQLPDETIVYDTTNHKVHCLNPLARLVWLHCDGQTSEADLVAILRRELGVPADETLVQLTLDQLGEAGLLKQPKPTRNRMSRRDAARHLARLGIATAAALVVTIAAPSVAQAASVNCASFNALSCPTGSQCTTTGGTSGTCQPNFVAGTCVCS